MFRWYVDSAICFAYLADYEPGDPNGKLAGCRWFTRGFTLQELIAPARLFFYDAFWTLFDDRHGLRDTIAQITAVVS